MDDQTPQILSPDSDRNQAVTRLVVIQVRHPFEAQVKRSLEPAPGKKPEKRLPQRHMPDGRPEWDRALVRQSASSRALPRYRSCAPRYLPQSFHRCLVNASDKRAANNFPKNSVARLSPCLQKISP